MAQPMYTSLDPLLISGTTLEIGRGNWQPGQDAGSQLTNPKWMAFVRIDGQDVRGQVPQLPSVKAHVTYPDELPWDQRCRVDLSRFADGRTHEVKVWIYAASYFDGWGDHPEDAWEWGHHSSRDGSPAVQSRSFRFEPAEPPPPPPADDPYPWMPHLRDAQDDLELAVAAFYTKRGQGAEQLAILRRQRFGMMHALGYATDEQRRRAHEALAKVFGWPL